MPFSHEAGGASREGGLPPFRLLKLLQLRTGTHAAMLTAASVNVWFGREDRGGWGLFVKGRANLGRPWFNALQGPSLLTGLPPPLPKPATLCLTSLTLNTPPLSTSSPSLLGLSDPSPFLKCPAPLPLATITSPPGPCAAHFSSGKPPRAPSLGQVPVHGSFIKSHVPSTVTALSPTRPLSGSGGQELICLSDHGVPFA